MLNTIRACTVTDHLIMITWPSRPRIASCIRWLAMLPAQFSKFDLDLTLTLTFADTAARHCQLRRFRRMAVKCIAVYAVWHAKVTIRVKIGHHSWHHASCPGHDSGSRAPCRPIFFPTSVINRKNIEILLGLGYRGCSVFALQTCFAILTPRSSEIARIIWQHLSQMRLDVLYQ